MNLYGFTLIFSFRMNNVEQSWDLTHKLGGNSNNSTQCIQYLCHQDVITGDVIHILINLPIQLSGQFNQDPPPVGDPFTLQQNKRQKFQVNIVVCIYVRNPSRWANGLVYLSKVEFFIWVRQASKFSGATIQVDIARPKSWEKANLWCCSAHCDTWAWAHTYSHIEYYTSAWL